MGWRQNYRSTRGAAGRAARIDRVVERHAQATRRILDGVSDEIRRDLQRVQDFEDRIGERPLSAGALTYEPATRTWTMREFRDDTGDIRLRFTPKAHDDPATFHPPQLDIGDRTIAPMGIAISRLGVFIAVTVTPNPARKPAKLIYKTAPTKNRIELVGDDDMAILPVESDLDDPVLHPERSIRIIAFPWEADEPLAGPIRLRFLTEGEPSIRITMPEYATVVETVAAGPTLTEAMATHLQQKQRTIAARARNNHAAVRRDAARAKRGCLVFLLMGGASLVALARCVL